LLAIPKQLGGFAKDVGVGGALKFGEGQELESSQSKTSELANMLEQAAMKAKSPEEKERLLKVAQESRRVVAGGVPQEKDFSPDVSKDYLQRGFETSGNIAAVAEAPAIVSMLRKGGGAIPKLPKRFSEKAIGEARDLAVKEYSEQGVKISGNTIVNAAQKAAEEAGADITPQMEKYAINAAKKYTDKELSPSQILKIFTNSQKAFTAAGKVGKSAPAAYNKAIHDSVAEEIAEKMPNVAKNTKLFRELFGAKKTASNVLRNTAGVAAGVGGGAYLFNLLRGRSSVQ
jgi:hypothetical protein